MNLFSAQPHCWMLKNAMNLFEPGRRVHFAGIGGVGMSGMARLLAARGCFVSGSDREPSETLRDLRAEGIKVFKGHHPDNVQGADLVILTAAVREDNPEIAEARRFGIPVMNRAVALGVMMEGKKGIAITGTHGKTTTTAMTASALIGAGLDPVVMVGGKVPEIGGNARAGAGSYFVSEADEFDRSFLNLHPEIAVITSIEMEHLDTYRDLQDIVQAYEEFVNQVNDFVVLCVDDPTVRTLRNRVTPRVVTCGLPSEVEVSGRDLSLMGSGSWFKVFLKGTEIGDIRLRCPGVHNVKNALAATTVALEIGVDFTSIKNALESFTGVERRFETLGQKKGITVIDDYAHHPTEITATLDTARSLCPNRLIAVFQPHLYSRTRDFASAFGKALCVADLIVVTDVYAARESPVEGITGELIVEAATAAGATNAVYTSDMAEVPGELSGRLHPGDLVVVMGAGDIRIAGEGLLERL